MREEIIASHHLAYISGTSTDMMARAARMQNKAVMDSEEYAGAAW